MPSFRPFADAGSLALDCVTSRLHLHEFVDGELEASAAAIAVRHVVARHLASCPRCARLERQLRAQRELLRRHGRGAAERPNERAPDSLRARVHALRAG